MLLLFPLMLAAADTPSYSKDVLPIFEANCFGCHGAAAKMSKLDLSTFEGLSKGGSHGPVIVPGKSADSRLYLLISGKAAPRMPMSGAPLAAGEIEIVKNWIDSGAKPPAPGEITKSRKPAIPDIQPKTPVHAQIGALAYSPDGKVLALGTFQEVRLADPMTGATIATLKGHEGEVRAIAFSPDGKLLAAAGGLPAQWGQVKIWDVEKRAELRAIKGHSDCIYAVAFAPDGKSVASSSYDKLIKLWDVDTGNEIRTFKDHIEPVYALVFTPDGKRLISGAADRSVKVWDAATGKRLYTLSEPLDGLNTIALSPAGPYVAAGGLDKTIRIWKLEEKGGKLQHSLIAHEDAILKLAYSPDGKVLVSTAADKTVKAFQADDLTEIKDYPKQPDWVLSMQFAPDGKRFAVGRYDGSLAFYDAPAAPNAQKTNLAKR
ncbi:MAG: hypothetical protein M3Z85_17230 [Acidobacteriota bacterium]|nr:hypothetical protein [Acidobacteriota bacterium]